MSNDPKLPHKSAPVRIREQLSEQFRLFGENVFPKLRVMAEVAVVQIFYMAISQAVVWAFEYFSSDLLVEFDLVRISINGLKIFSFVAMFLNLFVAEIDGLSELRKFTVLVDTIRDDEG